MAVQEEINHKQVALMQKGAKVTWALLLKAMRAYKQHQKNKQTNPTIPQGKMTVQELAKKGQGMSALDLTDKDLKNFDKVMKKYGVDYAIMTDKKTKTPAGAPCPPTHTIFFKGKDADAINKAFDELTIDVTKSKGKPSVLAELKKFAEIVKNTVRDKVKNKENVR